MWFAAVAGRFAYLTHRVIGHAVTWRSTAATPPLCNGDIVCLDCRQVLWCRAHDPWRLWRHEVPPDHWGAVHIEAGPWMRLERLQQVLRLADECPTGGAGDEIRRAACELVEAGSIRQQRAQRRRMLTALARMEWRQTRGDSRHGDPAPATRQRLTEALLQRVRPVDAVLGAARSKGGPRP